MTLRVARTTSVVLAHTFHVDETPVESDETVTVAVTDANGDAVASGDATLVGEAYEFTLPAQTQLAELTVAWTGVLDGVSVVETGAVEIVGGFLFSLVEGRASDSSLADQGKYPTSELRETRQEVEEECERICDRAFVPRYRRVVLDGTGSPDIVLPDGGDQMMAGILLRGVRTIRSAKVATRVGETFTALGSDALAALAIRTDGTLRRTDGQVWDEGDSNVIIEYEFGSDAPPADLKRASMTRLRSRLNFSRTGIPDRATSFTAADGGTYRISLPDEFRTGLPEVDAAYSRYSKRAKTGAGGAGGTPASRTLNYDPRHYSLFHGGRR